MKKEFYLFIVLIAIMACKKPYLPPAITAPDSYLVVEGTIKSGADSTFIMLSRTVNSSSNTFVKREVNAHVTVEGDDNSSYELSETYSGIYVNPGLMLNNLRKYRLRITTAGHEQYLSSFEPVLSNPPIDSVNFTVQHTAANTGIQIYVNTHDPSNKINYYRWDYGETWRFHSKYASSFVSNGVGIFYRKPDQDVYYCFAGDSSSSIILGSSAGLTKSVIYQTPITQIPSTSEKIEAKYSIEVNQYALTADAYNFWVNLKKNSEQLGSIFDAQPSTIDGNIQCISNPSKPVIGYISICNVQRKRVFIQSDQLPSWLPDYPYDCMLDTAFYAKGGSPGVQPENQVAEYLIPLNSGDIPVSAVYGPGSPSPEGYLYSSIECVDCTKRGSKKQPAFWK
ncbi:MAG: DUF4249 domain-containing protein [Sphingobacteriales bacterium]